MLLGIFALASCDSDRDDNPTLHVPDSFTLLQPTIGDNPVDLLVSTSVPLVAESQPAYGFPTQVTYSAQMSMTNNFTDSTQFYDIEGSTASTTLDVPSSQINLGVMTLRDYTSEDQVNTDSAQEVYVRLKAQLANDDNGNTAVYSNVQKIYVLPYFAARESAAPDYWFMTGSFIGDGAWTSDKSANAYLSQFPLSEVKDAEYDANGKGEFEAIVYMPEGAMLKLKHYVDSWDPQIAWQDGAPYYRPVGEGGNPDNITPTAGAGFYVVHLNTATATPTLTFTKSDTQDYPTHSAVSIMGSMDGWAADIDMTPAAGAGANNHMWTAHITFTETSQFKFRADHDWGTNWGYGSEDGEVNAKGFGTNGGHNIGVEPGEYVIYLNDIDGFFRVVPVGAKQMPEGATE